MMNRREVIQLGAGTVLLGSVSTTVQAASRKPVLRAAHITDVHILKEREAPQGVAAMLEHMLGHNGWHPELILNTGDTVMALDGKVTGPRAQEQIDLWKAAIRTINIPIKSCLGNHDVWDGVEPTETIPATMSGFKLMTKVLNMPAPYYSFDQGGWHFISLNSVCDWPNYGILTTEHFEWLKADLKATPKDTPVCVLSHLPIVSVTSSLYGDRYRKSDGVLIPKIWQHVDCWAISEIFRRHPNVRLCLSGHMHTQDRCEYRGVWYICGGAGSGAWWQGSEYGFPPCYGKIDFFADGSFIYDFIDYGWKARDWKGKELEG
jgi:3',5'-cyclic-AMP phosphodiesterase